MKKLFLLLIVAALLAPGAALGQGVSFQGPKIESQVPQPIAGLTIGVCLATSSGTPCTPTVSVFSDAALSVPISSMVTDGDGMFPTFFITPGQYQWCASDTLGRISPYCTKFTAPVGPGGSPSFVVLTVTGNGKFTETTAPVCILGFDLLWGDSTAHRLKECDNNGSPVQIVHAGVDVNNSDQVTATHIAGGTNNTVSKFNATGNLVNSGITDDGTTITSSEPVAAPKVNALINGCTDANITASIARLPAAGGIIDYTGSTCNLALGTVDVGSKQVTVYLGPFSYTADHIVIEANFRLLGSASVNVSGAGTIITSVGANGQPLIVAPSSGLQNIRGPEISNITFIGAAGNTTQDGMKLDISVLTAASVIDHLSLTKVNFSTFHGHGIYLKGNASNNGSFIQFIRLDHVTAVRASGTDAESFRATGSTGQIDCYSCQFDGPATKGGTNVYIGSEANGDTIIPYSLNFYGLTNQGADTCFSIAGGNQLGVYSAHHENCSVVYLISAAFTSSKTSNAIFANGYFATSGTNAGAGRLLKVSTTNAFEVIFANADIQTVPDRTIESTSGAVVTTWNNAQAQSLSTAISTTGVDASLAPAATMNIGTYHTVALSASGTSMTTLNSQLGPGEFVTFFANGTVQFATGGNITLPGFSSPLVLATGENATFANSDYTGTNTWRLISANTATHTLTLNKQTFTGSGTFTIPANVTSVEFTIFGGGGAGGGATAANGGAGGGSGGIAVKLLTGLTPANTITVTIGPGGTGVSGAAGNGGTASSISSGTQTITTVTANGGAGGASGTVPQTGGAGGTVSTNGDVNGFGASGAPYIVSPAGASGGATMLGGNGNIAGGSSPGNAASANTGSGGGGAGAGANNAGGTGGSGFVIAKWIT